MSRRRVVVTGLGLISPVGLDVPSAWANILAGKSGIQPITHFDVSAFSVRFGGPIYGFDVEQYLPKKEAKKMDPFIHYGIAAGVQALRDSGLEVTEQNAARIGVAIGSGIGGLSTIENSYQSFLDSGPRRISPFFVPSSIINMVCRQPVDHVRAEGAECVDRVGVQHRRAQHRGRDAHDPVRRPPT